MRFSPFSHHHTKATRHDAGGRQRSAQDAAYRLQEWDRACYSFRSWMDFAVGRTDPQRPKDDGVKNKPVDTFA